MTARAGRSALALALCLCLLPASCTDAYLYDGRRDDQLPQDRSLSLEGRLCTVGANEVVRPIKILLALDGSQSMAVTDPDGTRARAVIELFENLPNDPEVYVAVMVFAGSVTAFLTTTGRPEFERLVDLDQNERNILIDRLLNFTTPTPNRDATDFVKALADIYAMLSRDINSSRQNATAQGAESRGRYSVIFLSDGHPTQNQDDELLCGDAVTRIRQLRDLVEDVRFNTVHVFNPVQPLSSACDLSSYTPPPVSSSCRFPSLAPTACPMLLINQDAERLARMAELGGGDFRDFRNNEPINFLNFRFGLVRRSFVVKELVAANFSAPPGSPPDQADSDGDRLTDDEERTLGTDPWSRDTDGDGFSDGVEAHFPPNQVALPDGGGLDPGCPPNLRQADQDCDGLLDCDEQMVGTNAQRVDSDDDGVPDAVEWQLRTQASSRDLDEDPDSDGLTSRLEVRMHQHPLVVDSESLSVTGYRYQLRAEGPVDEQGRQCFAFRVDNVLLAPTLADTRDGGTGRGAGYNDVYLSLSMLPGDDPNGRTLVRHARWQTVRFPVGGIKSPVDGVIAVEPEDLVDRCGRRP